MEVLAEPQWPPGLAVMKVSVPGRLGRGRRRCERGTPVRASPPRPYPGWPRDAGHQFPTPETVRERAAVRSQPKVAALTNRLFWVSVTITASPESSPCKRSVNDGDSSSYENSCVNSDTTRNLCGRYIG